MTGRRLFRIHRAFGLAVAAIALVLAVTGLLLNHADDLGLAQRKLHAAWLLALYGVEAPRPGPAFEAGGHWISQWDGRLFLDEQALSAVSPAGALLGAFALAGSAGRGAEPDPAWAVATSRRLLLFTAAGELVDALSYPGDAQALRAGEREGGGKSGEDREPGRNRPLIESQPGRCWLLSDDLLGFIEACHGADAGMAVTWAQAASLPEGLRARIERYWRGEGVSLERVVLDLHNGVLIGRAGRYLLDAAGLAVLVLVVTGLLSALRRRGGAGRGR